MRGTSFVITIASVMTVGALTANPAAGQCLPGVTVTSVTPPIVGQSLARPVVTLTFTGTPNSGKTIMDGVAFTINSGAAYGQAARTYEFDVAGDGVTPGRIAVAPTAGEPPMPTADVVAAGHKLAEVINADPTSPVWAAYWYTLPGQTDIGIQNGWFVFLWKYDNQYGGITNAEVPGSDPANDMTIGGTFSANNPCPYVDFLRVEGTALNTSGLVAKLRSQADPSKEYTATTPYPIATASFLTLKVPLATGVAGNPPTFPPLGAYDLVLTHASCNPDGSEDVVFPNAVTLVENLLDDYSVRAHFNGSDGIYVLHNAWNSIIGPYWRSTNAFPAPDGFRKGSVHKQQAPRQYPFPTGPVETNNVGDNEHGSLQWSTDDGVHQMWQTIFVNFAVDTPLTLTGLWAGGSDHYPMTYGVQLRSGDKDGTIIAETPPGQKAITAFDWTDFAVSGVFPAGTTAVTVVFYGDHPTVGDKALHFDDLLLRVAPEHPTPPSITGMTTLDHEVTGETNATVTLTGANLVNGQTSVELQENTVIFGGANWANAVKNISRGQAFARYEWTSGDTVILTGGSNVTLGEYAITSKFDDSTIILGADINGGSGDITNKTVAGWIRRVPIAAGSVNATGSQVTATFDLTGAPASYHDVVVEVGTHPPIVWHDGFNVVLAGPTLTNGSFELPAAPQDCQNNRTETFTPASDWNVRFWNEYLENQNPILNFRDDIWTAPGPEFGLPSCPPPERGVHYASTATYNDHGTAQWSQTLTTEPGKTYILSGYFGHSNQFDHGAQITLSLLDGNSGAAPMAGGSAVVLAPGAFEDWTFGSVTGTATGDLLTVAWEVENQGTDGPRVAWIDHLVLVEPCHDPFADADEDGDVDQDDFALFQLCYTGAGGPVPAVPAYCSCFDTEGAGGMPDDDIDAGDLTNFEDCASGPTVPADVGCDD